MEIYNTATHQIETLTYYDRAKDAAQQQDSAPDLTADDPGIVYNKQEDRFEAPSETIDFWRTWFAKSEAADDLERELRESLSRAGHQDPDEYILENVNQHYSDHNGWAQQRIELLNGLIEKMEKN